MRHYHVSFIVDVDLKVSDEVMERAQEADFPYPGMDEGETVEMLARCLGVYGLPLTTLDGWADMDEDEARARRVTIELDDWGRLNNVE